MTESEAVRALASLAQASRLRMFRALVVAGNAGLTAGALAAQVGHTPAALSFHLKELSRAGLIAGRNDGRFIIYSADFSAMTALMTYLTENCCDGAPCLPACPPAVMKRDTLVPQT